MSFFSPAVRDLELCSSNWLDRQADFPDGTPRKYSRVVFASSNFRNWHLLITTLCMEAMSTYNLSRSASLVSGAACGLAVGVAIAGTLRRPTHRSFAGKIALITGGSRGLGLELARHLGAQGCKLILVARDPAELDEAANELSASGVDVRTIAADVSDRASIERLRDEALAAFGHIDILVNNAGIITVGPVDSFEPSDFERAMDTMYWGTARLTIALLPALLKTGDADIVNITSIGGKIAVPHLLPYSAAKFAA